MCAGVQNVSRPTVSCHEMSHVIPMAMLLNATVMSKLGQKSSDAVLVPVCPVLCDTPAADGLSGIGDNVTLS